VHAATSSATPPLLEIRDLRVAFSGVQGVVEAVRGVSLSMGRERVAVVGESGSGKSVTFRALLGLLSNNAVRSAERLQLQGLDLLSLNASELRVLRGRRIGMVVQDPKQGLNPVMTVGRQLAEMLRRHGKVPRSGVWPRVQELLAEMQIRDPQRVAKLYPHQLSGGMAQRVMLAMMLSAEPDLLIADEATSALDAVVRHRILALMDEQVRLRGMGLVLISHDLELVAGYADRVLVMYAGRVVEELPANAMAAARHPYTQGLLACRPSLDRPGVELPTLQREDAWRQ